MISPHSLHALLAGLLSAVGLFLCVAAVTQPLSAHRFRIQEHGSAPRLTRRTDPSLLWALAVDLSARLKPEGPDLAAALRRAGWKATPADFHARRMLYALLGMTAAVLLALGSGLLPGFSPGVLPVALAASLAALAGFLLPGRQVQRRQQQRREQLLREMGFGLDRISLLLQSGSSLLEALAQAGNPGLFGAACEQIAAEAETGRPISEILDRIRQDLPPTAALDEFLQLVRMGMQKGQAVQAPLRQRATAMRALLSRRIVENGQRARIRITLLTSLFILLASILVTILPVTLLLTQGGLF